MMMMMTLMIRRRSGGRKEEEGDTSGEIAASLQEEVQYIVRVSTPDTTSHTLPVTNPAVVTRWSRDGHAFVTTGVTRDLRRDQHDQNQAVAKVDEVVTDA